MRWKTCIPALGAPTYITREGRSWRSFDVVKFRADLLSSLLCKADFTTPWSGVDSAQQQDILVDQYTTTLTDILNRHAPVVTTTTRLRPRTDPWFDEECRAAKKQARLLERRFKRWNSDSTRSSPRGSKHCMICTSWSTGNERSTGELRLVSSRTHVRR